MRKNLSKDQYRRRLSLLLCLIAVAALPIVWETASQGTAAQTRSRPGTTQRRQRAATKPAAQPTPTPSALEAMGAPPPFPTPKPTPKPTPTPEQEINPGDVISVTTTEVMLPVTVRDGSGRLVNELKREDFRVFEDGRQQPLNDIDLRQVPVDVALMVDSSSSVTTYLEDFRKAAEGFAARLSPDDRISLIKFDDRVQLLQDWTQNRFQLRRALTRIEPGMFTRFNDALLLAAREQFGKTRSRRAVIVLSDGIDNGRGGSTLENALRALLQAQVAVYVVSNTQIARATKRAELDSLLGGQDASVRFNQLRIDDLRLGLQVLDQSEERLAQLAAATGGRLYKPGSFQDLDDVYAEVAEELRHQYALYYTPLNRVRDGGFRRVQVQTTNPSYRTFTRIGYFSPRD